ncbi:uncharacterized protein LOC134239999 [Saccostrea cucullata]|uniref:uncharacterized protein LOC134239999 n=1 Tax=Saccostrea cuccullata TaxID=36930 RepID=UPI002ED20A35
MAAENAEKSQIFSEVPQILTIIKTGFRWTYKVECGLSTSHFYVSGSNSIIKHMSTSGVLLEEIVTKSKNVPRCFTVNKKGQLIYSDSVDRSINIVKGREIERLVRLGGWKPNSICSTTADEILVALKADDGDEAKVVRYSQSKMTQEIQFNSDGQPLYFDPHYIDENKNSDIVVSDFDKKEIIVVDESGRYRFSYRGNQLTKMHEEFAPRGITTDSMCQILIADFDNNLIHIIDQDGQFLRYIENCNLHLPLDLSTNSDNVLFVVEYYSNKVKEVKYLK